MIYRFEGFALDSDRRELRRGTDLVALEPQVFDVLLCLVRNRQRVVSKDDLLREVWVGRIVSDSTLSSRITTARHSVGDSGARQALIRTLPHKGYRFVGAVRECAPAPPEPVAASDLHNPTDSSEPMASPPPAPEMPAIAVLPFANLSGDPAQEYFVDGVSEEITTALARFRCLRVIARTSSFAYKDRPVDVRDVGKALGARYVLEGSLRVASRRVRIVAQLIEAANGLNLWADRFDGELEDIFDLQDRITASVVGAIAPKLEQTEIDRAQRKPTGSLDAYDLYLRGIASAHEWTRAGMDDALGRFREAIRIDPGFAPAYGMAAYCYVQRKSYAWCEDRAKDVAECERLAHAAAELGRDDAIALARAAHAIAYVVGDLDAGRACIDRALRLNPHLTVAWYVSGWIRVMLGELDRALADHSRALALSPFDPLAFKVHTGIGYAHLLAGRYDDAAAEAEGALRVRPIYLTALRCAAASHALAGRLPQARDRLMRMRALDPALRLANLAELMPFRREEHFARWAHGLCRAGLPA